MFSVFLSVFALFPILFNGVFAANQTAASTLYFSQTETAFSINVANDSSDVFFYFTSPAFSWVAVGIGNEMKGSLMFIMYPSKDNKNVTISPRIGTGNVEPSFAPSIQLSTLPGTSINNETFVLNAVCHNCRAWSGGSLDVNDAAQPWIYAFGPDNPLNSDAQDAPLRRHREFGKFTMDMTFATGAGGVPTPSTTMAGVKLEEEVSDSDRAALAHGILFALVIFILWPANVILAAFFKALKLHMWFSGLKMVFIIIGFASGIMVSKEYNRSKSFITPHQILGFLSLLPILALSLLPLLRSRIPSNSQPTPSPSLDTTQPLPARPSAPKSTLAKAHTWLSRATWVFFILTGGLGLSLADSPAHTKIIYALVTIAVALPMVIVYSCVWRKGRVRNEQEEDEDRDMVLAAYYAMQPKQDGSAAQQPPPPPQYVGQGQMGHGEVLYQQAQGQWSQQQTRGQGEGWRDWQQRI